MITVLVAAYQGKEYLAEQLDSILNQSLPGLRILISDDGSDDGTWDIIETYVRRFRGRIRGIRHVKTQGDSLNPVAANFFYLLSQAEGDYILLSDQDDVWKKNKAECMMDVMAEAEADWGAETPVLLHSDAVVADRDLNVIAPSFFEYQHIGFEGIGLNRILVENPVTGGAVMMNKALLSYLRKAPEQCFMHDWWIAMTASCFGKIHCIREPLYFYRQHGSNTLGARKTGSAEDLKRRAGRGNEVKNNYIKMFGQASCFLEHYHGELTGKQTATLQAFLSLPYKGPVRRLWTVCRHRFYKNSGIQTLAQCLTMPGKREVDG